MSDQYAAQLPDVRQNLVADLATLNQGQNLENMQLRRVSELNSGVEYEETLNMDNLNTPSSSDLTSRPSTASATFYQGQAPQPLEAVRSQRYSHTIFLKIVYHPYSHYCPLSCKCLRGLKDTSQNTQVKLYD